MALVPAPNRFVITGKFTVDGSNSWRRADGTWSRAIAEAELHADEASAKPHVTHAVATEQREISDPYIIPVFADGATIDPLSARERIRANGPTIRVRRPD
jgi:sulfite reductase (NADPH) hemoprotein beta-component